MAEYVYAVSQLLALGRPDTFTAEDWPDYRALGLGPEHIPDLIRLATDPALSRADPESAEAWAPVHARRALGQLRAEVAVEPLLSLLDELDGDGYDEWTVEELPEVYRLIGPAAMPALGAYLANPTYGPFGRETAGTCLAQIGLAFPPSRAACVAHLTRVLARFAKNEPFLNALIIVPLLDLEARESLSVMEQAFKAGRVDLTTVDWRTVQKKLDLPGYRDDLRTDRPRQPATKTAPDQFTRPRCRRKDTHRPSSPRRVRPPDRPARRIRFGPPTRFDRGQGQGPAQGWARRRQSEQARRKNRQRQ